MKKILLLAFLCNMASAFEVKVMAMGGASFSNCLSNTSATRLFFHLEKK
jgi:hypothetical protein